MSDDSDLDCASVFSLDCIRQTSHLDAVATSAPGLSHSVRRQPAWQRPRTDRPAEPYRRLNRRLGCVGVAMRADDASRDYEAVAARLALPRSRGSRVNPVAML